NTFRDYNRVLVLKHPRIAINDPRITINNYMTITWVITWQLHVKDKHVPRLQSRLGAKASKNVNA
ncbi:MAG: hypothetical protein IKQ37_12845, partial [Bacteroidaceae bacterium]|nr:hypothetical protein [Bacteroidaceae bacterium]